MVPASGNLQVACQQFWFGPQRAGAQVGSGSTPPPCTWPSTDATSRPSRHGSRPEDLARLRADGARPAGPPPARPAAALAQGGPVEIDRTVSRNGVVVVGGIQLPIGSPLAGRRVTLRLEAHTAHVITDGYLWRSVPFTLPPAD